MHPPQFPNRNLCIESPQDCGDLPGLKPMISFHRFSRKTQIYQLANILPSHITLLSSHLLPKLCFFSVSFTGSLLSGSILPQRLFKLSNYFYSVHKGLPIPQDFSFTHVLMRQRALFCPEPRFIQFPISISKYNWPSQRYFKHPIFLHQLLQCMLLLCQILQWSKSEKRVTFHLLLHVHIQSTTKSRFLFISFKLPHLFKVQA